MSKRWVTVLLALAMVFACAVGMTEECPEGDEHDWSYRVEGYDDNPYEQRCTKCKQACPGHVWKGGERCDICGSRCYHNYRVTYTDYVCDTCGRPCDHEQGAIDGLCTYCGMDIGLYQVTLSYGIYDIDGVKYKVYPSIPSTGTATFTLPDLVKDLGYKMPEGMGFYKWSYLPDGEVKYLNAGDKITVTGDLTISADLRKDPLTITFRDGRTSYDTQMYKMEVALGSIYKLPTAEEIGFAFSEGYRLKAWEYGSVTNYEEYLPGAEFEALGDITYYASTEKYEVEKEYVTITFDANGGSGTMEPQVVEKGKYTTLNPPTFTPPEGYEFYAWYDDPLGEDGDGERYWDWSGIELTEDITLYADWDPFWYDFIVDPANGIEEPITFTEWYCHDDAVVLPHVVDDMGASEKPGHKFVGWKIDDKTYKVGETYIVKGEFTMTALWESIAVEKVYYTVSFDANGGDGEIAAEQVEFDTAYTLPACTFTGPTATPQFACWLVNGKEMNPGDTITVTANTTVKASWVKSEYTFTFKVNGGNAENGETVTETVKYGATYTLPTADKLGFTAQIGMDFNAWSTDGTNPVASNTVTNVRADMTFLALWKDASYTAAKSIEDATITEAMKEQGIDTPEKVVSVMEENAAQEGYTEDQVAHVDVVLMLWSDEANGYIEATEENFPEEGIEVAIDIPSEVPGDPEDYDFTLYHMTTTGSKAGQIEEIIPTVRGDKLHARFTGLSPVTIAWKEKIPEDVVADMPQTGDPSSLLGWVLLLGASGTGLMMSRKKK